MVELFFLLTFVNIVCAVANAWAIWLLLRRDMRPGIHPLILISNVVGGLGAAVMWLHLRGAP